jgi:hypothetical protein
VGNRKRNQCMVPREAAPKARRRSHERMTKIGQASRILNWSNDLESERRNTFVNGELSDLFEL